MLRDFLRWARITKSGSDSEQFHTQQMEYLGKVSDGVMVFPYGVHGNLPEDSLALMFSVQGNPENRAAIGWTPKNRPKMAEGEVTFYHPPTNSVIAWRSGGNLEITTNANVTLTAGGSVTINAPTWTLNGNMVVNGTMTNNGKDVGDTHQHAQANDSGGNTEQNINGVL